MIYFLHLIYFWISCRLVAIYNVKHLLILRRRLHALERMLTTSRFLQHLVKNYSPWLKCWRKNFLSFDCSWIARKRKSWRPLLHKRHHMLKYVVLWLWLLFWAEKWRTNIWAVNSLAIWIIEPRWKSRIVHNVHGTNFIVVNTTAEIKCANNFYKNLLQPTACKFDIAPDNGPLFCLHARESESNRHSWWHARRRPCQTVSTLRGGTTNRRRHFNFFNSGEQTNWLMQLPQSPFHKRDPCGNLLRSNPPQPEQAACK